MGIPNRIVLISNDSITNMDTYLIVFIFVIGSINVDIFSLVQYMYHIVGWFQLIVYVLLIDKEVYMHYILVYSFTSRFIENVHVIRSCNLTYSLLIYKYSSCCRTISMF